MTARGLPLKTPRLVIRDAQSDDLDDLFAVYSDPEVMAYWDTPPDAEPAVTASRIKGLILQPQPHPYRVIEHAGRAIGCMGIHSDTEIGFILGRAYWRKGFMSEALAHFLPWAFETLDLPHITAEADPRNAASLGILAKFGFEETGRAARTLQINGVWVDSVYLRLQRPS